MLLKIEEIHQGSFKEIVVRLCDKDLLGKNLGDDFFVNPRFYKGQKASEKRCAEAVECASMVNAIGKESVDFLLKKGFITKENVTLIGGVPHAQIFVVERR